MHLTITTRPAKLGKSINTRTEHHGEETRTAFDIPLDGILLNDTELNALLEDPKTHGLVFTRAPGGDFVPRYPSLGHLALESRFEECWVELAIGIGEPLVLEHVRVASVKLTPLPGGFTEMRCKVQCTPNLQLAPRLLERLGSHIDAAICLGEAEKAPEDAQQRLPLQ